MAASVSHDAMANAIRFLSLDAVEKAKSGHPGLPMGMADVATVLWRDVLKFDPADAHWPDRDRFVLSGGHGCMLLYSLLYLTGVGGDKATKHRRHQAVSPGRVEDAGAPGILVRSGRGDDDRPARAGDFDRGRHGDRGAHAGRPLSRRRRPPYLRHRLRRRFDGRREPGGDRHRRPSQAQEADRLLGQQRDLDRRADPGPRRQHRSGRPFPVGGLEFNPHRRPRSQGGPRRHPCGAELQPADDDRLQDDDRLRPADPCGDQQGA